MAHRYRLYPGTKQKKVLLMHASHARLVFNVALSQANMYRDYRGPTPNAEERGKQLTAAREAIEWLREGSSSVQQQALRDFTDAMKNWWAGTHGHPKYRSKHRHNSFRVRDVSVEKLNRHWATINVPKLGPVKFRLSRPLPAKPGMATIKLDRSGRWHVSFTAPQPEFVREQTGAVIGVDMGVTHTATTSNGDHLDMGALLTEGETRRLRLLQRKLARQTKGSKRRQQTRHRIAVLKARQTDRRKDWTEKTTTTLVRENDVIVIEDLKIKNMTRSAAGTIDAPGVNVAAKRGLNRQIVNQAWGLFRTRLEQKAAAATSQSIVVAVNPANTSRRCHNCGHIDTQNRKNQAEFACTRCAHTANADVNAAQNILAAGLAVTGRGGTAQSRPPDETSTTVRAA